MHSLRLNRRNSPGAHPHLRRIDDNNTLAPSKQIQQADAGRPAVHHLDVIAGLRKRCDGAFAPQAPMTC